MPVMLFHKFHANYRENDIWEIKAFWKKSILEGSMSIRKLNAQQQ